jgi:hypothetical protein
MPRALKSAAMVLEDMRDMRPRIITATMCGRSVSAWASAKHLEVLEL